MSKTSLADRIISCTQRSWAVVLLLLAMGGNALAGPSDPITGARFDSLVAAQQAPIQAELKTIFSEADGFLVTGPLDPFFNYSKDVDPLYHSLRVICPDLASLEDAVQTLKGDKRFAQIRPTIDKPRSGDATGFRGIAAEYQSGGAVWPVQFHTTNQTRWLIWALENLYSDDARGLEARRLREYSKAVSEYLYAIDRDNLRAAEPQPNDFGVPEQIGLYEPPPAYVIEGYQNYKDYLESHAAIQSEFAGGILAFVPSDSLVGVIIKAAPEAAYPNKEAPMLQHEYRKFFARGGSVRVVNTLSSAGFDTLSPGEYFFAVGLSGNIRFGRELLREEVDRIEATTGQKVPRANHSFLFPGEPVLTAGAFVVGQDGHGHPRIARINAQSGHYFYSNVSPTIREDIAIRSNEYILTLGHFLAKLKELEIPFDSVLISKL